VVKWNLNSCRLDAYFTLVAFIALNDSRFSLELVKSREHRKLKETLINIKNSSNIETIQKLVDNFAIYRESKFKEKVGDLYSITPLFQFFQELSQFQFAIEDKKVCQCKAVLKRSFQFGPLLFLTTKNLKDNQGDILLTLNEKLGNYSSKCHECGGNSYTKRIITKYPTFLFILLEICDELNSLEARRTFKEFVSISVLESFKIENYSYSLAGICYFQKLHYTVHIKGVKNSKMNLDLKSWIYHDSMVNNGQFIESSPKFEYAMTEDELIPYILLFKLD